MTTVLKPYPDYKPSGIDWLGRIPTHWRIEKLKNLGRSISGGTPPMNDHSLWLDDVPWVSPKDMKVARIDNAQSWVSAQAVESGLTGYVQENALLMVVRSGILRHTIPVAVTSRDLAFNQDIKGYAFRRDDGVLAAYIAALISSNQHEFLTLWRKQGATVESLEQPWIDNTWFPAPPLPEQQAIADFLDAADARITRFIAAKRKMIALLEEQKQAIINQAVTRGLDPDVPKTDSGVDWLGDIPAHWEVMSLGRLLNRIEQGWSPPASNDGWCNPERWAVTTLSAVKAGVFDPSARKPLGPEVAPTPELTLHDGDFLLTRANTRKLVGDVAIVSGVRRKLIYSDLIYRLQWTRDRVLPEFALWALLSGTGRYQIERDARASNETMVKVNHSTVRSWVMTLPSLIEQRAIVNHIYHEVSQVNAAIDRSRREIELIREYRTRLISDVVTGKLDVRGADLGEMPAVTEVAEVDDVANADAVEDMVLAGAGGIHDA